MWETIWFGYTFFDLYAYFMIYSFLGWAMESAFVSITTKKWVNRGFVNGPMCPIYGTGALLILVGLDAVANSIPLIFLGGLLIATVVEYLIGAGMERLFHATWWDYSDKPCNLKGRICLERSLEWGLVSVIVIRVIQPMIAGFVAAVPRAWGELLATILLAYLAVDTTITVLHVLRFNEKLERLSESHTHLREKLESTRLYGAKEDLAAYFENMTAREVLQEWKNRMAEEETEIHRLQVEERLRREHLLQEVRERLESRVSALENGSLVEKRLLNAFPGLRSKHFDEELRAWRIELEDRKAQIQKQKQEKKQNKKQHKKQEQKGVSK